MPLEANMPSPFRPGETTPTWSFCDGFGYQHTAKVIGVTYLTYADAAAAYSGGLPQGRVEARITGDEFDEIVAQHPEVFGAVMAILDNYMLTRPEFAAGQIIPPGPPEG